MAEKKAPKLNPEKLSAEEVALNKIIQTAQAAQKVFATFTQEQVDAIFKAGAMAACAARVPLARDAVDETGMGIFEDKVIKNNFASELVYDKYKDTMTCGEIFRDDVNGIVRIAEPIGVIAGVIPTTNPTSTAIFKTLMALKTRNAIVFSPHPRAKKCTALAAKIVNDAAVAAGAPEGLIACIEEPTVALSAQLMNHPGISIILATGGPGMVKAAYSSGKPALGVGAGNTSVIIDETADLKMAVSSIIMSKTFDNGVICASEQAIVAVKSIYNELKAIFASQGAHFLNDQERETLAKTMFPEGRLNPGIVGQTAVQIAEMAGIKVAATTKVLVGEVTSTSYEEAFAKEKLSPILGFYKVDDFDQALTVADELIVLGGLGHTSCLYTNDANADRIAAFGDKMQTARTLINTPAAHGAIGGLYNFILAPSLTLGCGSWGGNSVSENVGAKHLINIKTVARRKENMLWFRVPPKTYFKPGSTAVALDDLKGKKKAFIVTDRFLLENGYCDVVLDKLKALGITTEVFADVPPNPTLACAKAGAERLTKFGADTIIAIGGGSPMDAAKIMWVMYEHPEVEFKDLAMRFMDVRRRVYTFPTMGKKAYFVAITTTSGTGAEVTPFAVITDEESGQKYPLADYELTPNMAIVDAEMCKDMPKSLTAFSGIDALTHSLEAIASVVATDFTNPMALESIDMIFKYLPRAYQHGAADMEAREKIAHASCMAGMAFANGMLGICHSMAHKLGAKFHVPHGLANALLINKVIEFNAVEAPNKMGTFAQYKYPQAIERYARVARYVDCGGKDDVESVKNLIAKIDELKKVLDIPRSIGEAGVDEAEFNAAVDQLSLDAFDDQCTSANPRYPLVSELKELFLSAYKG
jgi:acetaldehyde dehydrogenase/alcohol dehydrogenase